MLVYQRVNPIKPPFCWLNPIKTTIKPPFSYGVVATCRPSATWRSSWRRCDRSTATTVCAPQRRCSTNRGIPRFDTSHGLERRLEKLRGKHRWFLRWKVGKVGWFLLMNLVCFGLMWCDLGWWILIDLFWLVAFIHFLFKVVDIYWLFFLIPLFLGGWMPAQPVAGVTGLRRLEHNPRDYWNALGTVLGMLKISDHGDSTNLMIKMSSPMTRIVRLGL